MKKKNERTIGAGEFKAKCLKLLDEVQATRTPLTITKHGKPVATVVPFSSKQDMPFGCMKETVGRYGDIVGSTGATWHAEED